MKNLINAIKNLFTLYTYDITDTPFTPNVIEGHEVLCIVGNKAICGQLVHTN